MRSSVAVERNQGGHRLDGDGRAPMDGFTASLIMLNSNLKTVPPEHSA